MALRTNSALKKFGIKMSASLQIYHYLPPWARNFAASVRGYYLDRWRYDSNTEKLVEEALERDYWSEKQWTQWREERLAYTLHRAATKVPFYRETWDKRRQNGDRSSWEYLENWDILEKDTLRKRASEFIADDCNPARMFLDHTSGTTGTSLNLWIKKETVKYWYAIFEARSRRWYGISRDTRWAILGGQMVTPVKKRNPPFWVWNAGMNQLYLSSYHLAPDLMGFYLDALKKYRVRYILGYSSALYSLAQTAIRENRKDVKMDVVISNAEPLFDYQKEVIAKAFDCPVRETYGMAEMVAAASECEKGSLHRWPDVGVIEGENDREGSLVTDFICTGLVNADMPLIRYKVGDRGSFSDATCDCGRTLPLMGRIEGRSDDVLYTADGRTVGRLDPVFKNDLPVIEAQIIQKSLAEILVKYVPTDSFSQRDANDLSNRIRERMGDVQVKLEKVEQIPRTTSGKFRAVVCELSVDERLDLHDNFDALIDINLEIDDDAQLVARENSRIEKEYHRREVEIDGNLYAPWQPAENFTLSERKNLMALMLHDLGKFPLRGNRCLEIGYGKLGWLADLISWGLKETDLHGIELDPARAIFAQRALPEADLRVGDAAKLPWEDETFDFVIISTVFSSILEQIVRKIVASEVERVLKPGGVLIWYDLVTNNPANSSVSGIGPTELKTLFQDFTATTRSITLIPPIARLLAPKSVVLATILSSIPFLRTHLIGALIKQQL